MSPDPMTDGGWLTPRRARWLLITLGLLVFGVNLDGPFLFDDLMWVEDNRAVSGFLSPSRLLQAPADSPIYGRPFVTWTLAANYAIGGLRPLTYHLVNIALHIAAALALFAIVRRTLSQSTTLDGLRRDATMLAFASASLWLVHPLQTECVNYISQRTESLSSLLMLLTIYCSIRADVPGAARWRWAATLCCLLGVATKEVVALAPLIVILYDLAFGERGQRLATWKRRWPLYASLVATWIPLALLLSLFPRRNSVEFPWGEQSVNYLQNQAVAVTDYLRLLFWPDPLVLDYGYPRPIEMSAYLPAGLLIVALLIAALAAWRFCRPIGFLGTCFFLLLGPTSSLLPILSEVAAERRMYLPSAALIVLLVTSVYTFASRRGRLESGGSRGRVLTASLVIGLLLLSTLSVRRCLQYRSSVDIWKTAVAARPENHRAAYNLAVEFNRHGRTSEAITTYQQVLLLRPKHARTHNNLAAAYQSQGKYALAIEHFGSAITCKRGWRLPVANLAWLLATCDDPEFRNGEEAVRLAEWLCKPGPSETPARFLDTLAAAQAETGAFSTAVQTAELARQQARLSGDQRLADQIAERVACYQRNQPYEHPFTTHSQTGR